MPGCITPFKLSFIIVVVLIQVAFAADNPSNNLALPTTPSINIPALPAYATTLKELGYSTIEEVIQHEKGWQKGGEQLAFDGKNLLTIGADNAIKVWDLKTSTVLQTLPSTYTSALATHTTQLAASGGADGMITLWNPATGEVNKKFTISNEGGPLAVINALAFLDDTLIASGSGQNVLQIWDIQSGQLKYALPQGANGIQALATDEKTLVMSGSDNGVIKIWNFKTGELQRSLLQGGGITALALNPHGLLASAGKDHTVKIWQVATGELKRSVDYGIHTPTALSFKGDHLAIGSSDGTTQILDASTGAIQHRFHSTLASQVNAVVFINDLLVTAASPGYFEHQVLEVWNLNTGSLQQTLQEGGLTDYTTLATSYNGLVATGSSNGTIEIWNAPTGTLQRTLQASSSTINGVAFNEQGLLATGSGRGALTIWDSSTGQLKQTLADNTTHSAALINGSGNSVLVTGSESGTIRIEMNGPELGQILHTLQETSPISALALDDSGLLDGTLDGTIHSWALESGELSKSFNMSSPVRALATALQSTGWVAAGAEDGTIKLWDTIKDELKYTWQTHSPVLTIAFGDRDLFAAGTKEWTIRVWDTNTGQLTQTIQTGSPVLSLAFSSDGGTAYVYPESLLASGAPDGTVKLWELETAHLRTTWQVNSPVNALDFNKNGALAAGTADGKAYLWSQTSGKLRHTFQMAAPITDITFSTSPTTQLVASSAQGAFSAWDTVTGDTETAAAESSDTINAVAFKDHVVAAGTADGVVKLWDSNTGQMQHSLLHGDRNNVYAVALNNTGLLASAGGNANIWSIKTGKLQHTLTSAGAIFSVAFNNQGLIATGASNGVINLWDEKTGQLKKTLQSGKQDVWTLAFDQSGLLATSDQDGNLKVWEVNTGTLKHDLKGHTAWIRSIAFTPDGVLVSQSDDKTLRMWDVKQGKLIKVLVGGKQGQWNSITPDGKVMRADNGSLLRQATLVLDSAKNPMSYKWQSVLAPTSSVENLTVTSASSITIKDKHPTLFTLNLSNSSDQPIHQPKILETTSSDGNFQIIAAEPKLVYPSIPALYTKTSLILPQQNTQLAAQLMINPTQSIPVGEYQVPVTVEVSGGNTKTVNLTIKVE